MIKECPNCKRTYEGHSFTFCLADGALLSAPFDPNATKVLSEPLRFDPPLTAPAAQPLVGSLISEPPTLGVHYRPLPTVASPAVPVLEPLVTNEDLATVSYASSVGGMRRLRLGLFVVATLCLLGAIYTGSLFPAVPALALYIIAIGLGFKRSDPEVR
ncbi:MAG: hypothetical protein ABIP75_02300 [Pyrinomonadaceae bacterium]